MIKVSKNVLVAIPCLMLGGTEYQTLNLVRALSQSGYSPIVLCYFEHDSRMVDYMRDAGAQVVLMSPEGKRPKGLWPIFMTLWKGFKNALYTFKPEIVHVQYMAPGSLAIIIFKLLGARRIIATAHVPGHIYTRKWIPQLLSHYVCDLFLCVSQSSEQAFFETNPSLYNPQLHKQGRKHFTVYNCTDISEQTYPPDNNEPLCIGMVSRLSREKGVDRLIEAAPAVLARHPDIRFLIVGDGSQKTALQSMCESLGVSHAFEWAGLQPKESLPELYKRMDIVAIPSRFEGFGLTAIEAMSYSKAVIASNVDGLREVIEDGISGLLFDPEANEALTASLNRLIEERDLRFAMGRNGHSRVKALFSYNIYQKTIFDIYTHLV